jgi:hypothetical protein
MGELAKVVALALRESGESNGDLATSVRDRTPAFDAMKEAILQLIRDIAFSNTLWREWTERHDAATKEILDELRRRSQ